MNKQNKKRDKVSKKKKFLPQILCMNRRKISLEDMRKVLLLSYPKSIIPSTMVVSMLKIKTLKKLKSFFTLLFLKYIAKLIREHKKKGRHKCKTLNVTRRDIRKMTKEILDFIRVL